jgi:RND family efflux transporter MFP subunit
VVIAAAAALSLASCGQNKTPPPKPAPLAVDVVSVAAPSDSEVIAATGTLKRRREITLSFRAPGVIERLLVDDGDFVRKGQVVAALDPTALEARVRQTKADLDRARRDLDRLSPLADKGAISHQQLDAQKNAFTDAEAAYAAAAFDRRWANLVAPADGVVLARVAQAGEVVQPGQAIVSIADETSPLVLRAPLSDKDALRLKLGSSASITLDALPGRTLSGQISRIGQQAGPASGQIQVEATLPGRDGLRSGMIAHLAIKVAAGARFHFERVPAEAVLEVAGQRAYVMVFDAARGVARRTEVRFGGFDGDAALVDGLPAGARVITAGAGYASDGQAVHVVDAAKIVSGGAK